MRTAVTKLVMLSAFGASALAAAVAGAEDTRRAYVGGRYELSPEGAGAGFVSSMAGGSPFADVVVEKTGADRLTRKHIGGVK